MKSGCVFGKISEILVWEAQILFFVYIFDQFRFREIGVTLPRQEPGASIVYKYLSPSGCRYISRQESGVLCG